MIEAIDLLCQPEIGFAELVEHGQYITGRQSTYKAGNSLLARIDDYQIAPEDLGLSGDEEIVILKDEKLKGDLRTAAEKRGLWIDYEDTELSNKYREEVHRINQYLVHADIDYNGPKMIDLTNRRQRRYFNNNSFMEGGRLFGGFWLTDLRKSARKNLIIDGCSVVECDYKSMMPSLAYANNGLTIAHDFDPYLIPALGSDLGERLRYRTGVKRLFGALMFSNGPLKGWPKGIREENFKGLNMRLDEIIDAIKEHNTPIADLFERGAGHHYHFEESEIIVDVVLECIDRGITALQIHDGVLVPHARGAEAAQIMRNKFLEHTGQQTIVTTNGKAISAASPKSCSL